jgi:histidinol-phosphatase (PHP family)
MWSNFHTHSNYCDGKGELDDYIARAKASNMISLGFSSHAPVPFESVWCMKQTKLDDYLRHVNLLKSENRELQIYKSLEIDYVPNEISPLDFKDRLDYTIGSIHFVEKFLDGRHWEVDGTHQSFMEGYESIFDSNIKDAIVRYYELTREMIRSHCPDIIGHLDKIKIQNKENTFFEENDLWYQQEIKKTLNLIQASGAIVEVNTRGIYQKKSPTTYPSPWILKLILEKDIPITINSDAHHPDDLIREFSATALMLKAIGFEKLTILHEGLWKSYRFNEQGIIIN